MKQPLTGIVLICLSALSLTGCTNEDFRDLPQDSIPLKLGEVTVAGMKTATRAAISENAQGYTGVRKSRFVDGNELNLTLSHDGGTSTTDVTATLTGGVWVLDPARVYIIPGTTTITAVHNDLSQQSGMDIDCLTATTYTLTGQKVTLDLKHDNALVDITCAAGIGPTAITLVTNNSVTDKTYNTAIEEEANGAVHYRSIVEPRTLKSITAVVNGMTYVATLATPVTLQGNKRYPISLSFKADALTAAVGNGELNWGAGDNVDMTNYPTGYDRYIGTPEDLAQFAKDVNDDVANARNAKVLQVADIDLSKLMPLVEAQAGHPDKGYTYTATAALWIPIGSGDAAGNLEFNGKFNGNGHTISNVKTDNSGARGAFFNSVKDATLTGIHLRGAVITDGMATLTAFCKGTTVITLCSATGTVTCQHPFKLGGLVGQNLGTCYMTRCSADVEVTSSSHESIGGLVGVANASNGNIIYMAGCIATGNVTGGSGTSSYAGGLIGRAEGAEIIGCMAAGNVSGMAYNGALLGTAGIGSSKIFSCYATGTSSDNKFVTAIGGQVAFTDCAYTRALDTPLAGVIANVTPDRLYATLTANRAKTPAPFKTLHWSKADGYTPDEVSETWHAKAIWKDNGAATPTIDMGYEGGPGPAPEPIITGNTVYPVNSYWVTAPDADESKQYQWAASTSSTMDSDPCASHGSWRMPTMKDFEVMAGWTGTHDFGFPVNETQKELATDATAFLSAFPAGNNVFYWTSVAHTSQNFACVIKTYAPNKGKYTYINKPSQQPIRCVQPQ